jgi:hypothetical protein
MPAAWLVLIEVFCAFGLVFSTCGLYWTRDKPADWMPPAWYRAGYFGPVHRDRFRLSCLIWALWLSSPRSDHLRDVVELGRRVTFPNAD